MPALPHKGDGAGTETRHGGQAGSRNGNGKNNGKGCPTGRRVGRYEGNGNTKTAHGDALASMRRATVIG
jgi:hypothetical protein